jgi:hypothetical protein
LFNDGQEKVSASDMSVIIGTLWTQLRHVSSIITPHDKNKLGTCRVAGRKHFHFFFCSQHAMLFKLVLIAVVP